LNISPLHAFILTYVVEALPTEWCKILKTCNLYVIETFNLQNQVQLHLNGQNVLLGKAVSKIIYKEIRNSSITPLTAQLKHNAQFASDELDSFGKNIQLTALCWLGHKITQISI